MAENATEAATEHPDGIEAPEDSDQVFVWFDGQRYEISGIEPDDYPRCRDQLEKVRKEPIAAVGAELQALAKRELPASVKEQVKKELLDRAYRDLRLNEDDRKPTREEVVHWIDRTEAGAAYTFFLMLGRKQPDMTEAKAAEILKAIDLAEFRRRRDQASRRLLAAAGAAKKE
jgi:hypothetical protein